MVLVNTRANTVPIAWMNQSLNRKKNVIFFKRPPWEKFYKEIVGKCEDTIQESLWDESRTSGLVIKREWEELREEQRKENTHQQTTVPLELFEKTLLEEHSSPSVISQGKTQGKTKVLFLVCSLWCLLSEFYKFEGS